MSYFLLTKLRLVSHSSHRETSSLETSSYLESIIVHVVLRDESLHLKVSNNQWRIQTMR